MSRTDAWWDLERDEDVPGLVAVLRYGDVKDRARAAFALGRLEAGAAGVALMDALDDERPAVREAAVSALGDVGELRAVPLLILRLGTAPRRQERALAAVSLGKLGDPAAIDVLTAALDDRRLRGSALTALGRIDDARARTAVVSARVPWWRPVDRSARRHALRAIAKRAARSAGVPARALTPERRDLSIHLIADALALPALAALAVVFLDADLVRLALIAGTFLVLAEAVRYIRKRPRQLADKAEGAVRVPEPAKVIETTITTARRELSHRIVVLLGEVALILGSDGFARPRRDGFNWPHLALVVVSVR